MIPPLYVRPLTQQERDALEDGLRSKDAFTLRRSQILLASAQGQTPRQIAIALHCAVQTVRNAIHAFEHDALGSLQAGSSRPLRAQPVLKDKDLPAIRGLLEQSPRTYGKPTSVWSLSLLAQVAYEQGLSDTRLSYETIRQAIKRLGLNWKRAKHWIASPDPAYTRKKSDVTA
jgi:transposase